MKKGMNCKKMIINLVYYIPVRYSTCTPISSIVLIGLELQEEFPTTRSLTRQDTRA